MVVLHDKLNSMVVSYFFSSFPPCLHVVFGFLALTDPPGRPVISEYRTGQVLMAGESRILVCHVLGGNPSPRVMWYRHGRPINQEAAAAAAKTNSRGRRNGVVTSAHPARQLKASGGVFVSQQVTATREEDGAVYECRVNSDLLMHPYTTNVTLTVQCESLNSVVVHPFCVH